MGTFLSLTSVVGKTKDVVIASLARYASSAGGGLEKRELPNNHDNFCVVAEEEDNTTILYPYNYLEWDDSAEFISKDLNAPAFSFHIHDGDLWMYIFFVNGAIVDQFNPIPEYWDDTITTAEMRRWKGNATMVTSYIDYVTKEDIEKYLVHWDFDEEIPSFAYPGDSVGKEDWQLLDFMKKLRLPYPLTYKGDPDGNTYQFWTKANPLKPFTPATAVVNTAVVKPKPWWKLW